MTLGYKDAPDEMKAQYIEDGCICCPFCTSYDVSIVLRLPGVNKVCCLTCEQSWIETYTFDSLMIKKEKPCLK